MELAAEHRGDEKETPEEDDKAKIRELIGNRKRERAAGNKGNVKQICKLLRREIRARDKASKTAKIEKILKEFKGLKAIAGIRNDGKMALVGSMKAGDGSIRMARQDIANAFADFYESLYASACAEGTTTHANQGAVDKITGEEVASQIKQLSKNKCADEVGIVAEIRAAGGEQLAEELASIFDDIIQKKTYAPKAWRTSKIVVL